MARLLSTTQHDDQIVLVSGQIRCDYLCSKGVALLEVRQWRRSRQGGTVLAVDALKAEDAEDQTDNGAIGGANDYVEQ